MCDNYRRLENEDRSRFSKDDVKKALENCDLDGNVIVHILENRDKKNTYSVMYHVVCEHCDYCDSQGDVRTLKWDEILTFPPYQEDPYYYQKLYPSGYPGSEQ